MSTITYLDIAKLPADESDMGPAELARFWGAETARWVRLYREIDDELNGANPFSDLSHAIDLREELARVAANVVECAGELAGWTEELGNK